MCDVNVVIIGFRWYLGSALRSGKLKIRIIREENYHQSSSAIVNGYDAVSGGQDQQEATGSTAEVFQIIIIIVETVIIKW